MQQQAWPRVRSTVRDRIQQQAYESTTIVNGCGSSSSSKEEFCRSDKQSTHEMDQSVRKRIQQRDGSVSSKKDAAASLARVRLIARTLFTEEREGKKENIP